MAGRDAGAAVVDDLGRRAFAKHQKAIARAKESPNLDVLVGGELDDSVGYFVRPVSTPLRFVLFTFGVPVAVSARS